MIGITSNQVAVYLTSRMLNAGVGREENPLSAVNFVNLNSLTPDVIGFGTTLFLVYVLMYLYIKRMFNGHPIHAWVSMFLVLALTVGFVMDASIDVVAAYSSGLLNFHAFLLSPHAFSF
jgi:hypothetical protein